MTTREYINAKLSRFGLSDELLDLIFIDNDLEDKDTVDTLLAKEAIYNSLSEWLPLHSRITEGGVTEEWDIKNIRLWYSLLCKELGKEDLVSKFLNKPEPVIKDMSNSW